MMQPEPGRESLRAPQGKTARPSPRAVQGAWNQLPSIVLMLMLMSGVAHAKQQEIEWSHPDASTVTGFRVVIGPTSRNYTNSVDVGLPAASGGRYSATVTLPDGHENFLAIVPYNAHGEGPLSQEVHAPLFLQTHHRVSFGDSESRVISGEFWSDDTDFSSIGNTRTVATPIAGTTRDVLYQSERWGGEIDAPMTFDFPVPNGDYVVTLHWAETWPGASAVGARVFDVHVEGTERLRDLDVFSAAGGAATALERTLSATVSDQSLTVDFLRQTSQTPIINAIEIVPLDPTNGGPTSLAPPIIIQIRPVN